MGHSRKRPGRGGRVRYTAYYVDEIGHRRSAGSFATRRESEAAWQRAEARVASGLPGEVRPDRRRFGAYVAEEWLPNHVMELRTRQHYPLCQLL